MLHSQHQGVHVNEATSAEGEGSSGANNVLITTWLVLINLHLVRHALSSKKRALKPAKGCSEHAGSARTRLTRRDTQWLVF